MVGKDDADVAGHARIGSLPLRPWERRRTETTIVDAARATPDERRGQRRDFGGGARILSTQSIFVVVKVVYVV